MFIELHMLQSFAPSNLNRDDTGSPKDSVFGGHRRARISSQAFKAAIRREPIFAEITQVPLGQRTKIMAQEIAQRLSRAERNPKDVTAVAVAFAKAYSGKMDNKAKEKTSVLLYLSEEEFRWIANQLDEHWDTAVTEATTDKPKEKIIDELTKTLINETKGRTSAPDIALFGRMLASNATTNIDAACQVAHAVSTHRVNMEMDYYTAIDHIKEQLGEEVGAEMVGFTSFNSACFYRYLRLDWRQLLTNLGWLDEDEVKNVEEKEQIRQLNKEATIVARRTVEGFLRAAIEAIPTGKQNAFAAQNATNLALIIVRNDGKSWNLINAFETPIEPQRNPETGYIAPSIRELDAYWHDLTNFYDDASIKAIAVHAMKKHQDTLETLAPHLKHKMSDWVNTVLDALPQE